MAHLKISAHYLEFPSFMKEQKAKSKVKFSPLQAIKVYRENGGSAPVILSLSTV
jgi:hypothetical protein